MPDSEVDGQPHDKAVCRGMTRAAMIVYKRSCGIDHLLHHYPHLRTSALVYLNLELRVFYLLRYMRGPKQGAWTPEHSPASFVRWFEYESVHVKKDKMTLAGSEIKEAVFAIETMQRRHWDHLNPAY